MNNEEIKSRHSTIHHIMDSSHSRVKSSDNSRNSNIQQKLYSNSLPGNFKASYQHNKTDCDHLSTYGTFQVSGPKSEQVKQASPILLESARNHDDYMLFDNRDQSDISLADYQFSLNSTLISNVGTSDIKGRITNTTISESPSINLQASRTIGTDTLFANHVTAYGSTCASDQTSSSSSSGDPNSNSRHTNSGNNGPKIVAMTLASLDYVIGPGLLLFPLLTIGSDLHWVAIITMWSMVSLVWGLTIYLYHSFLTEVNIQGPVEYTLIKLTSPSAIVFTFCSLDRFVLLPCTLAISLKVGLGYTESLHLLLCTPWLKLNRLFYFDSNTFTVFYPYVSSTLSICLISFIFAQSINNKKIIFSILNVLKYASFCICIMIGYHIFQSDPIFYLKEYISVKEIFNSKALFDMFALSMYAFTGWETLLIFKIHPTRYKSIYTSFFYVFICTFYFLFVLSSIVILKTSDTTYSSLFGKINFEIYIHAMFALSCFGYSFKLLHRNIRDISYLPMYKEFPSFIMLNDLIWCAPLPLYFILISLTISLYFIFVLKDLICLFIVNYLLIKVLVSSDFIIFYCLYLHRIDKIQLSICIFTFIFYLSSLVACFVIKPHSIIYSLTIVSSLLLYTSIFIYDLVFPSILRKVINNSLIVVQKLFLLHNDNKILT